MGIERYRTKQLPMMNYLVISMIFCSDMIRNDQIVQEG